MYACVRICIINVNGIVWESLSLVWLGPARSDFFFVFNFFWDLYRALCHRYLLGHLCPYPNGFLGMTGQHGHKAECHFFLLVLFVRLYVFWKFTDGVIITKFMQNVFSWSFLFVFALFLILLLLLNGGRGQHNYKKQKNKEELRKKRKRYTKIPKLL